jgi:predicted deacylase
MKNKPLTISNLSIQPGEKIALAMPTPELYTCAKIHIPIHVLHGKKHGPVLVICAAMHGDEMNGIAMIQKLLNLHLLKSLSGTLIAIPVLNINGLIMQNRSLLDRRDLESSFPGNETGSFASRLAHLLTTEIFSLATHCIDLHSGEPQMEKQSQVQTFMQYEEARKMANAFGAPVTIDTDSQRGLLWLAHKEENPVPTIIYDTGETMRLDVNGIREGVKGIVRVMRHLQMLPPQKPSAPLESIVVKSPPWIYSSSSGLCRFYKSLGDRIHKGSLIARISDPFGTQNKEEIFAPFDGMILARTSMPIVNEGDSIVQIVQIEHSHEPILTEENLRPEPPLS